MPYHFAPKNAAERYENRVDHGIGICAMCGATVYLCIYRADRPATAGWHEPGKGVDHPDWERIHTTLPKPCKGLLLNLPTVAGEH